MKLRIMTFNIQHGLDFVFRRIDLHLMAEVIKRVGADIVSVNEVRGKGYTYDEPALLAAETGFYPVFGAAICDSHGEYGNLVLSRFPIVNSFVKMIPDPDIRPAGKCYETRCIVGAEIAAPKPLTVLSSHFGLNSDEKINAVAAVCEVADAVATPLVLMGDFNMTPDDSTLSPIYSRLKDASVGFCDGKKSFNSVDPTIKIDYIFTSSDITVTDSDIPHIVASDHRPHWADIEL